VINAAIGASLLILLLAIIRNPAQADDKSDVLAANKAFERAFSNLDINAIEALWARDENVTILHPISKAPLIGWEGVRKSWEGALSRYTEISVTMNEPHVSVGPGMAWVVGVEKVQGRRPSGEIVEFAALTTNVFEKRDGRWLMVHHHGSRMPQ